MQYDFDSTVDRRGLHSVKWSVSPGELPMWVADMDFIVAPPITDAIKARADVPSFGYTEIPDAWRRAVAGWWAARHDWQIQPEALAFCTGVIPALASIVRSLTPNDGTVLVQAPVYNHFFSSIANSGRAIASSDLVYEDGRYHIDWQDLERKLADPGTSLFFLCNPHNPTGQIWSKDDLAHIGQLAAANGVVVVADEIHCDITDPAVSYTPFALAAPDCPAVVCLSATKTFSIPGLQTAAVVVEDEALRKVVFDGLNRDEIAEANVFAIEAAIAAFTQGGQWADQMRAYVHANKDHATAALQAMGLHVVPGQATYLLWIDCASLVGVDGDTTQFCEFLRATTGLYVSEGALYWGPRFFRWNVGCPRSLVDDGLNRLARAVQAWPGR